MCVCVGKRGRQWLGNVEVLYHLARLQKVKVLGVKYNDHLGHRLLHFLVIMQMLQRRLLLEAFFLRVVHLTCM